MTKLAVTLAMTAAVGQSRQWHEDLHPLMQAGPEVNSIVREDGGISMRVHKVSQPRQVSHSEALAMRK